MHTAQSPHRIITRKIENMMKKIGLKFIRTITISKMQVVTFIKLIHKIGLVEKYAEGQRSSPSVSTFFPISEFSYFLIRLFNHI